MARAEKPALPTPAAIVRLEGRIDDYNYEQFVKRFDRAKAAGAKVVIVDIDTYGGLVSAGLDISKFLKSQNEVRTIAFVSSKAISAGAMIALACDEIVMNPVAQLGDCAPIVPREGGGIETLGQAERAKAESPILADFAGSAARNGYDPLLVQSMVSVGLSVYWVQSPTDASQRRFVDKVAFEQLGKNGWTLVQEAGVANPIDGPDSLLTVDGKVGLKLGLSKADSASIEKLASTRNYNIIARFTPSFGDSVVEMVSTPAARGFLIVLFLVAIYAAMHAPGHGLAELVAVLALALLVGVPLMTGYAQWWEILVILVGVVLLALELFVIPGFGVAGIVGIICLIYGLVMTFVGPDGGTGLSKTEGWWGNLRTGLATVVSAMAGAIVVAMVLKRYLPKMPYFGRLILTTVSGDTGRQTPLPGAPAVDHGPFWPAVGAFGEAVSDLKPGGSVAFYDPTIAEVRVMSVISATGYVSRGAKVTILDNRDNRLLVRPHEG